MGYFFVSGPLGGLKSVSGDVFGHVDSIGSFKKNICISSKNRLFSKGSVSPGFLVKNGQILKYAFFSCLCPSGSQCVTKRPSESFLGANNALTKNFPLNSHPDFIFCGLFLCPWSLGRPKKCLRGRFWTH